MRAGLAAVKAGATENDVAAAVMAATVAAGSEYFGMEPFVTSGPRSGVPHSTWRRRRIEKGDVVILETAGCFNRYHAALFRTAAVGDLPPKARDMYRVCQEGLATAIEQLRPGRTCADVHDAAQAVIDGVDVPLEPGMVFHVPITLREYAKWTVAVSEAARGSAPVITCRPRAGVTALRAKARAPLARGASPLSCLRGAFPLLASGR